MTKKKIAILGGVIALAAVAAVASLTPPVDAHVSKGQWKKNGAVRDAIKANDYNAFQEAAEGKKIGEIVENENEFNKLVEAHNLREEARELMKEIGFEPGQKHRHKK